MRPRKTLLPLTLENITSTLAPGKPYSADALALIFDAPKEAIRAFLESAVNEGAMFASREVRGFRRNYWIPEIGPMSVATRRLQPGDMKEPLTGYDPWRLMRLAMGIRRA